MTKKDYSVLKSWGDLRPEQPHLPQVGKRIKWTGIGQWRGQKRGYIPPKLVQIEGYPTFECPCAFIPEDDPVHIEFDAASKRIHGSPRIYPRGFRCPLGGTYRPLPRVSVGDRFYATLRAYGYTLRNEEYQ